MASLALALGMADTVRGAAGGIDLDALFLDEGFGTLDPDALSDVLAVLDAYHTVAERSASSPRRGTPAGDHHPDHGRTERTRRECPPRVPTGRFT